MSTARKVKLYRDGDDQAVHIPRDLELPGDEAWLRDDGDGGLLLQAVEGKSHHHWLDRLAAMPPLRPEDEFPEIEDPLPEEIDPFAGWSEDETGPADDASEA